MAEISFTELIKKYERYIHNLPAARNRNTLTRKERDTMQGMLDTVALARGQAQYSANDEDPEAQELGLKLVLEHLQATQEATLMAGGYDLLGPADVAELSALNDLCQQQLRSAIQLI